MKKILLGLSLALIGSQAYGAVISTNLGAAGVFLLSTNRASIYSVTLQSPASGTVSLFDCDSVATPLFGTNYFVTSNLVTQLSYPTNVVSSYVNIWGYTNWYTNSGWWTVFSTNTLSFTNALSPTSIFAYGTNIVSTYNVDLLHARGLVARPTANVTITLYYNTGQ